MTARLSKKQKVLNLLSSGKNVAWTTIRNRFDLTSPRAMIDTLKSEGHVIYVNTVGGKTFYRLGTPSAAIITAGIEAGDRVVTSGEFLLAAASRLSAATPYWGGQQDAKQ